jgi:hypothetical protein
LQFRYRGSRRESAVAQLFSLGHIMRARYFIGLALILGWQASIAAAMFYFNSQPPVTDELVAVALIVPFIGYFVAFYGAPAFAGWSRVARPVFLTFIFSAATVIGFWFLFGLMFFLFMAFGGHHW